MTDEDEQPFKSVVFHEDLPAYLKPVVRALYEQVGWLVNPTCEQWEFGFCHDLHPEREVRVWLRITHAFWKYLVENELVSITKDEARLAVAILVVLSTGADPSKQKKNPAPEALVKELDGYYADPTLTDWDKMIGMEIMKLCRKKSSRRG